MSKWVPDRKIWSGGVAAIAAYIAFVGLAQLGVDLDSDAQLLLSGLIGYAIQYLVPPSAQDVIKRIDNTLVEIAAADPRSKVSAEVGRAAEAARLGVPRW